MIGRVVYHAKMLAAIASEKASEELKDAREWARLLRSVVAAGGPREWVAILDKQDFDREALFDVALEEKRAAIKELGELTASLADLLAPLTRRVFPSDGPTVPVSHGGGIVEGFGPVNHAHSIAETVSAACVAIDERTANVAKGVPYALVADLQRERDALKKELATLKAAIDPVIAPAEGGDHFSVANVKHSISEVFSDVKGALDARNAARDELAKAQANLAVFRREATVRIEALENENLQLKSATGQTIEARKQRKVRDEARIAAALEHECDRAAGGCGAEVGEPCMATVTAADGPPKLVRRAPHPCRFEAAFGKKGAGKGEKDSDGNHAVDASGDKAATGEK